jgi:glucose/arabinose dehydrogenase
MLCNLRSRARAVALAVAAPLALAAPVPAQEPEVVDPDLAVTPAVTGLSQPISIAFLGRDDMLVAEKASGQVKRVVDGEVRRVVLDLAVNSASERGLLGVALHPRFRRNGWVYLFWSESRTGADSAGLDGVRLLGNRIDRFTWDGRALEFDRNIIQFRSFQADAGQPLRGNHNGGVLRFGPDGKLYAIVGDTGRRGQLQNLAAGPFGPGGPDDQFGGPEPDDAHRTGVIVRLDDDGSAPRDNPFFRAGRSIGGEVGANIQRIFAYGVRNSFGLAFDPRSGDLWEQENGDDSFSELNRVEAGMNSGWVQVMGPIARVAQFKAIETDPTAPRPFAPAGYFGLQQIRWPPTNIADTPEQARGRLFMLPGAHFSDPELSWKFEVSPGGIGFLDSRSLGREYRRDLFMGGARDFLEGGHLFRIELTPSRREVDVEDPRLEDGVADNVNKWEITESESLLFGRNFGVGTDVQTGPDGHLYVVSLSKGAVYEVHRRGRRDGGAATRRR